MVQLWNGVALDGLGVVYAFLGALAYATYLLLAEREVASRDTISLMAWGFGFSTRLLDGRPAVVELPGTRRRAHRLAPGPLRGVHLPVWALVLWVVVLGTIAPFSLIVGALRHVTATRAGVTAMLEPVVATVVAWAWLRESLSPAQLAGAAVVLAGIGLAQTAR